ncbi:MAG: OmpH family outer membrane protein [Bacteroidota bacterium]|nr:OmpH family outer membrane protein [Bacteroidota bacterium]
MKKIKLLVLLFMFTINGFSQTKIAHVAIDEIIRIMPAVQDFEKNIKSYIDKEQIVIETMVAELQSKTQEYETNWNSYDDPKKQNAEIDLQQMQQRIALYKQNIEQQVEKKKADAWAPIEDNISKAIENVAKEGGYTYIVDSAVLHYADKNSDVTSLVRKELGL